MITLGTVAYTMKHKGKILELFVKWKKNMKKNTGRKIKVLRSDNREEIQTILSYSYIAIRA